MTISTIVSKVRYCTQSVWCLRNISMRSTFLEWRCVFSLLRLRNFRHVKGSLRFDPVFPLSGKLVYPITNVHRLLSSDKSDDLVMRSFFWNAFQKNERGAKSHQGTQILDQIPYHDKLKSRSSWTPNHSLISIELCSQVSEVDISLPKV